MQRLKFQSLMFLLTSCFLAVSGRAFSCGPLFDGKHFRVDQKQSILLAGKYLEAQEKLQNTYYKRESGAEVSYDYDWSDLNNAAVLMSVQSGSDVIGIKKEMIGVVKNWQESGPKLEAEA